MHAVLFKHREIRDLNRGRLFVSDIFNSRKIPHFESLDQALDVIVQVRNGITRVRLIKPQLDGPFRKQYRLCFR